MARQRTCNLLAAALLAASVCNTTAYSATDPLECFEKRIWEDNVCPKSYDFFKKTLVECAEHCLNAPGCAHFAAGKTPDTHDCRISAKQPCKHHVNYFGYVRKDEDKCKR